MRHAANFECWGLTRRVALHLLPQWLSYGPTFIDPRGHRVASFCQEEEDLVQQPGCEGDLLMARCRRLQFDTHRCDKVALVAGAYSLFEYVDSDGCPFFFQIRGCMS